MAIRGRMGRRVGVAAAAAALVSGGLVLHGCSSTVTNRDPTGEVFPSVMGQSLEKERRALPEDLSGSPSILLVGYRQGAQFDIDRWLMGLIQARVGARVVEVPTIPGLAPTIASGWIDDGMRSGIPKEDWGSVVTLYGNAASPVVRLTGNERGRLARVLVLDGEGRVRWFDDEGYSPRKALDVAALVERLRAGE